MENLTNEEKAAIILLSLDEQRAAEVMRHLRPSEIKRVGRYMSRISTIPAETINAVAKEFINIAKERGRMLAVQQQTAKNIVARALGEKEAESLFGDASFRYAVDNPIVDKLRDIDPKLLLEFTKTEHPQTIALILANMKPDSAAVVMENMTPAMQVEVTKRMANLKSVPYEFIEEVARTLEKELLSGTVEGQQMGGVRLMADIINRLNPSTEQAIMAALEESDPDLAYQIRSLMFTFEDVLKLDDKSLQEVLREVSSEDLAKALKVVDPAQREKIYRNMSKRGAEMLKEEIDLLPPTRVSEVEKSQRTIVDVVKRLEAEGRIALARGAKEDEFV
ncbi:MAG: flagellar motor switch protein FliG [Syntrophales bacterium]|nr:flagellar motor switch protein FliG [Syntrophales bacterium]